ncbi:MAG TPA: HEAT repeat domain-containing protein [Terriglobia bacterium]|nr:HEAT repeat domain-containing protein [Terriglobia bacterium]
MLHCVILSLLLFQNPSLDSASPKERQAAVEQMAVLGNRDAIPKLGEALKKESKSDIRASILAAFGRIRDRDAIPFLADSLRTDLDKNVRLQAIDSVLRLYIPIEDSGQLHTIFGKVKSVFFEPNPPVVGPEVQVDPETKQALAAAMQKDFDDDVRAQAARALGTLKAKDQVPVLTATLEDPQNREHRDVRIEIIRSLALIRDPAAGPALEKALRDPNKQIVLEAIPALGLVTYTPARPTLESLFRTDKDSRIKSRSLEALALLRDKESISLFESLLNDKNDYYRELAAEGLARLDYKADGWKDRFDQERKPNVRNALAFGLASSGQVDYINNLATALDSRQDYQAEAYLYELGKFDGQMNELYRYLKSSNPKVRAGMAKVIGNIGDPTAVVQIRPLTEDSDTEVVREAVSALRKLNR